MEGYKVTITKASKELTVKEKISIKDFSNATAIDSALENEDSTLIITPAWWASLNVHNEKSKDGKDYRKYVIVDVAGNKYVTGSESFFTAFMDIMDEIADSGETEEFSIEVRKMPSKNYKGKYFIY